MPKLDIGDAEIYYEEKGSGPPLLLVPGLGGGGAGHHASGAADGPLEDRPGSGETYVFFGPQGGGRLPALVDLSQPFPPELVGRVTLIYGASSFDTVGEELTTGDFNGDGWTDLVLGAITGNNPGPPRVVFRFTLPSS